MALHLVDTNNNDRSAPTPNTKDVLIPDSVKAHNTVSTQYNTDATTQTGFVQQRNMQIIANDGTDNVGLFGFNNALNAWGLFQTKAGTDVTTNTDLTKFIFNSQQDVFKIAKKIPVTIPQFTTTYNGSTTSGYTLLTTAHGLTITPVVQVFVEGAMLKFSDSSLIASSYVPLPLIQAGSSANIYWFKNLTSGYYVLNITFGVDATNVYIQASYAQSGNSADTIAAIPATIFALQETAT